MFSRSLKGKIHLKKGKKSTSVDSRLLDWYGPSSWPHKIHRTSVLGDEEIPDGTSQPGAFLGVPW